MPADWKRAAVMLALATLSLSACSQAAPPNPAAPAGAIPTAQVAVVTAEDSATAGADLSGIKTYLLGQTAKLRESSAALKASAQAYYSLAEEAGFDYSAVLGQQREQATQVLAEAQRHWQAASPAYEQMEGIVAGVPALSEYDVILDAGTSAEEDPANAVPFDLSLADGRVLKQPGNLFGVLESTLWGTDPAYVGLADADLNADGRQEFGEVLPDAAVLLSAAEALDSYAAELANAAESWQPTTQDAFTALVVMVPTMSEYFESWKQSRFVAGEASTQRDFVVISRLADITDILSGLDVVYDGVSPLIDEVDPAQREQIGQGLSDLQQFVADIHAEEQGGKSFRPEDADVLGSEAQSRAAALAGQIAQAAAQLKITIAE